MDMKYRLVTPGPAMVPPEVLLELAKPVKHHRTAENKALIAEAIDGLKKVFCTQHSVALFTSSGTGGMEATVANVIRPGQKALVISAGKWGERWEQLVDTFRGVKIVLKKEYGQAPSADEVKKLLAEHPDTVAVFATLSETSTAVGMDIAGIGRVVKETPALLVVDGISGVGAMVCKTDEWGVDMLVVGGQKALMLPPGLAMVSVSPKAKAVMDSYKDAPSYYLNLPKYLKALADNDTPYTPAHTLIAACAIAVRQILKEGIEETWKRTQCMCDGLLAAVEALGLKLLAERPSASVTAICPPDGIDAEAWAKLLEKKYGVKAAGGQGSLKGKILRVAHMGYMDPLDIVGIVAALEWSLRDLKYDKFQPGAAVSAATKAMGPYMA